MRRSVARARIGKQELHEILSRHTQAYRKERAASPGNGGRRVTESIMEQVRSYLSTHVHPEFDKPFELDRIELCEELPSTYYVFPKGVPPRSIRDAHLEWEDGLRRLGTPYEVDLLLPHDIYCG